MASRSSPDRRAPASTAEIVGVHPDGVYDVGTEAWIPVVAHSGPERWGLQRVLTDAHLAADLDLVDPLERYATLRLLLSLTYQMWARQPDPAAWQAVVDDRAPLPAGAAEEVIAAHAGRWWLWHPVSPFMQHAGLRQAVTKTSASGRLDDVADPIAAIVATAPSKSTESWWGRQLATPLTHAEAALAVVTRHFTAGHGNEADVTVAGKKVRWHAGGPFTAGRSSVSHLFWQGPTLASTLAANLARPVTDTIGADPRCFFDDPDSPAGRADALWRYSASAAATLLVWPGSLDAPVTHVLRAPQPQAKDTVKQIMEEARVADPHTIKVRKKTKGAATTAERPTAAADVTWIDFSAARTQFANVYSLYRRLAGADIHDGTVANVVTGPALDPDSVAGLALWSVNLTNGGNGSGHRIAAVSDAHLPAEAFLLPPTETRELQRLLATVAGPSKSSLSLLRDHTRMAVVRKERPKDVDVLGDVDACLRNRSDDLLGDVEACLWNRLDALLGELYRRVRAGERFPSLAGADADRWVGAVLDAYDQLTGPHDSITTRRRIVKHRAALRASLYRIVKGR